jgi:2-polyprenyl-6-methoxyphenol hydroxylase-like FAD-dependent oxidoreductase
MMNAPSVLIAGAGPTGMAMAIELKRAGMDVRVIDKSDHMALHSQALVVQARTLEQFQRYGIADAAVAQGRKLTHASFWSDGKKILAFPFDRIPSRYPFVLFLPQNQTEALLNEKMELLGVRSERGSELVSFTQQTHGVEAKIRHGDGREETVNARWLIGCDGAHSAVRQLAGIPFQGGGVGISFFLGDLEMDGPDVPFDELSLHLHAGDLVFMGPLSDKLTRVIVATHAEQGKDQKRDVSIPDFQRGLDRMKVRATVRSAEWMTPFHVNDLQARHYRQGNVFLAGDAAHIHSPVGGQGMNTGIQDAANLAWKLVAVANGADESLLDSYESERGEVGKALLRFTERGLKLATASHPLVEKIRDAILPIITRPSFVQDLMLGFISETAIEYRSSSIVTDLGGDGSLRAGDRMPDVDVNKQGGATSLLQHATQFGHLAVLVNVSAAQRQEVASRLQALQRIDISDADLDDAGRKLLGSEEKVLVVRPDGYIGFRGTVGKADGLKEYLQRVGLDKNAAVA